MVTGRGLQPRRRPSVVTVVLLAVASSLVANLATNTVEVSWRWWPHTVWAAVGVLVVATVVVELARARSEKSASTAGEPTADTPQIVKHSGSGPLLTGNVKAGRDVNVADSMYVDNRRGRGSREPARLDVASVEPSASSGSERGPGGDGEDSAR